MGNAGYFNWSTQASKGTQNVFAGERIYCMDTNFMPTDLVQARKPHIGGHAFAEDGYKAGTGVAGTMSMEVPGEHIGFLLYFLSGEATGTGTGTPTGSAEFTFKMATDEFSLPWFTFTENKDDVIYTTGTDGVMVGGRFVWTAGDALSAMFTVAGITPAWQLGATGTDAIPVGAEDTSPILVCSNADAWFKIAEGTADEASQVVVDFVNVVPGLTEELKIGSPYRRDITKLARVCTATVRHWLDADLWKAIYFGTASIWGAAPYMAKLEVNAASGSDISGGTEPYSLEFKGEDMLWGPCAAPAAAQRITMVETQATVTVPAANDDFLFTLNTAAAMKFKDVPAA